MTRICKKFAAALTALMIVPFFAHAGDLEATLGDDGIYHYDWYHQSFLEIADDVDEALASGKVLMVKWHCSSRK
ncbi:MAG: hypothetical protein VW987_10250 [Alphaproteobacteria bacterium]